MELFEGRPADVAGRLPREVRTYDFWIRLGSNIRGPITSTRTPWRPAMRSTRYLTW